MNDVSFPLGGADYAPLARRIDPAGDAPDESIVSRYYRIAFRWRWLILGSIAAALLVGVLATLLATPQFTATTRMEINREGSRIVNVEGVQPEASAMDQEFYQTQYGVLASRTLAERVARKLRLSENRRFFELFKAEDAVESFDLGGAAASATAARDARFRTAVDILEGKVKVSPIRLSRLVDVGFTSPEAKLSADVANSWANEFILYNLERRFDQTAYARRFLEGRLEQLRRRLEASERQLVGFASQQSIINVPTGTDANGSTQERSLVANSLTALNDELARATGDRVRAESRLQAGGASTAESLANPTINTLRGRRAEIAAEVARLRSQFEPGYPAVQALTAQLRTIEASLAREEGRVSGAFQSAYDDASRREQALVGRIDELKRNFVSERRRGIEYNIFQRDVDTNRELYNGLLQRYKEIGVAGGVGTNNVSIVDPARTPERPSSPRPLINLFIALLAGTVLGLGLAFVREQIDETITDPSDVERRVGLPLLGVIPRVDSGNVVADLRDPKSNVLEAYLSVQTSLAFSTDHGVPRVLSVTSTRPAEGKSTTSLAIAYSIARNGARTVLVDADMRSPSVHSDLGLVNDRGVSNYLSGTSTLAELVQFPEMANLGVLTAGPQPPNAAELLRGHRLEELIAELLTQFQHVVIDSPPVLGLADAPLIASRTEATIFVIEATGVKGRIARQAIARLRQGRAQILGSVLTKFEAKRAHFGYGYDYGYGYGYGSEDKRKRG
ncbi:MAG TPA: polysaccharide biosynthesis tyrosine autokinase [Sphingomonas sp.]|uniref:GumC family protein n=1 Tax=Sphingomonas sp. TaxID=28214 RepID=UPI002EDBAAA8